MHSAAPLPFPQERGGTWTLPASLSGRGIGLRAARGEDIDWLLSLYRELRAPEFAELGWPQPALHAFLDQQFMLQHVHYLRHYGEAEFLIVEQAGRPVGRFYLLREAREHLLVDISLAPASCGQGLGSALIAMAQQQAGALGRGMRLHVESANTAAQRLYERLGFRVVEALPTHIMMRWAPAQG